MRSLLLLGFGALCGAIATVLLITLDPNFPGEDADGAARVGNASVTLSEEALEILLLQEISTTGVLASSTTVNVKVRDDGLIDLRLGIGASPIGFRGSITLDPNVVDGQLRMDVVDTFLGDVIAPTVISALIERPLRERMDSMASGLEYRLTAISTKNGRLTLEIEI
jgi:hypothetical protein